MFKALLALFVVQIAAVVAVYSGAVGTDIVAILASTWIAYLWGRRHGKRS